VTGSQESNRFGSQQHILFHHATQDHAKEDIHSFILQESGQAGENHFQ